MRVFQGAQGLAYGAATDAHLLGEHALGHQPITWAQRTAANAMPERARVTADRLGVEAFATIGDALEDGGVKAVAIAVPNDRHADVALAAIAAGKDVLLEKPMALTVSDAEAVAAAARRRGV